MPKHHKVTEGNGVAYDPRISNPEIGLYRYRPEGNPAFVVSVMALPGGHLLGLGIDREIEGHAYARSALEGPRMTRDRDGLPIMELSDAEAIELSSPAGLETLVITAAFPDGAVRKYTVTLEAGRETPLKLREFSPRAGPPRGPPAGGAMIPGIYWYAVRKGAADEEARFGDVPLIETFYFAVPQALLSLVLPVLQDGLALSRFWTLFAYAAATLGIQGTYIALHFLWKGTPPPGHEGETLSPSKPALLLTAALTVAITLPLLFLHPFLAGRLLAVPAFPGILLHAGATLLAALTASVAIFAVHSRFINWNFPGRLSRTRPALPPENIPAPSSADDETVVSTPSSPLAPSRVAADRRRIRLESRNLPVSPGYALVHYVYGLSKTRESDPDLKLVLRAAPAAGTRPREEFEALSVMREEQPARYKTVNLESAPGHDVPIWRDRRGRGSLDLRGAESLTLDYPEAAGDVLTIVVAYEGGTVRRFIVTLEEGMAVLTMKEIKPTAPGPPGSAILPLGLRYFGPGYLRRAWWIETGLFGVAAALLILPFVMGWGPEWARWLSVGIGTALAAAFGPGHLHGRQWLSGLPAPGLKEVASIWAAHAGGISATLLLGAFAPWWIALPATVLVWTVIFDVHRRVNLRARRRHSAAPPLSGEVKAVVGDQPDVPLSIRLGEALKPAPGVEVVPLRLAGSDVSAQGDATIFDLSKVALIQRIEEGVPDRDLAARPLQILDPEAGHTIQDWVTLENERGREGEEVAPGVPAGSDSVVWAANTTQGHFWINNTLVVIDGRVVTRKPGTADLHSQGRPAPPLNGVFWTLSLDENKPGVFPLRMRNGAPEGDIPVRNGFAGPLLVKDGRSTLETTDENDPDGTLSLRFGRRPTESGNDLDWRSADQRLAMTVYGYFPPDATGNRKLVVLQTWKEAGEQPEPALRHIVETLRQLGVTDAVLGGTSADTQRYLKGAEPQVRHAEGRVRTLSDGTPRLQDYLGDPSNPTQRRLAHAVLAYPRPRARPAGSATIPLGVLWFGEGYLRRAWWIETIAFGFLPSFLLWPWAAAGFPADWRLALAAVGFLWALAFPLGHLHRKEILRPFGFQPSPFKIYLVTLGHLAGLSLAMAALSHGGNLIFLGTLAALVWTATAALHWWQNPEASGPFTELFAGLEQMALAGRPKAWLVYAQMKSRQWRYFSRWGANLRWMVNHIEMTTAVGYLMAIRLNASRPDLVSRAQTKDLWIALLGHDAGKMGDPDDPGSLQALLTKRGPLSDDEWRLMRRHVWFGADRFHRILSKGRNAGYEALRAEGVEADLILEVILQHHHGPGRRGYPDLPVDPRYALVVAVSSIADAFSSLTMERPYSRPLTYEAALKKLEGEAASEPAGSPWRLAVDALKDILADLPPVPGPKPPAAFPSAPPAPEPGAAPASPFMPAADRPDDAPGPTGGIGFTPAEGRRVLTPKSETQALSDAVLGPGNLAKEAVVFEPHSDDAALSMGGLLEKLVRDGWKITVGSALPDVIGVTDDYVRRAGGQLPDDPAEVNRLKAGIRMAENAEFSRRIGLKYPDDFSDLGFQLPFQPEEKFVTGHPFSFDDARKRLSDEQTNALERFVLANLNRPVWFVPYPFSGKHHVHHEITAVAVLHLLRRHGYRGRIIFYETDEYDENVEFDGEGKTPNLLYVFGQEEMDAKRRLLRAYGSQLGRMIQARRETYDARIEKRNRRRAASVPAGDLGGAPFVERFVLGTIVPKIGGQGGSGLEMERGNASPGALAPWHFLAAPVSFLLSLPFVPGLAQTVRKAARPWVTVILAAVGEGALIYGLGIWLGWTPAVMALGFAGVLAAHFLLGFLRWDQETGDWKPVWFASSRSPPSSREFWDPYLTAVLGASMSLAAFLPALWPAAFGSLHPFLLAVGPHLTANLLLTYRLSDAKPGSSAPLRRFGAIGTETGTPPADGPVPASDEMDALISGVFSVRPEKRLETIGQIQEVMSRLKDSELRIRTAVALYEATTDPHPDVRRAAGSAFSTLLSLLEGGRPALLTAVAEKIASLSRNSSSRFLGVRAYRLTIKLLIEIGALPRPGANAVAVSFLNGGDPFLAEQVPVVSIDKSALSLEDMLYQIDEVLGPQGIAIDSDSIRRNSLPATPMRMEETPLIAGLLGEIRRGGRMPGFFVLKNTELFFIDYLVADFNLDPGETRRMYENCLLKLLKTVVPPGSTIVLHESGLGTGGGRSTENLLASEGWRDVLPEILPEKAALHLRESWTGAFNALQTHGPLIPLTGRVRVFRKPAPDPRRELTEAAVRIVEGYASGDDESASWAEDARLALLVSAGALPRPGEGFLVSVLNGPDVLPFRRTRGLAIDGSNNLKSPAGYGGNYLIADIVLDALRHKGLVVPRHLILDNLVDNIVMNIDRPDEVAGRVLAVPSPGERVFLLKHAERYYRLHFDPKGHLDPAESAGRAYRVALGTLLREIAPERVVWIEGEGQWVTPDILSEAGYRDATSRYLPAEAVEALDKAGEFRRIPVGLFQTDLALAGRVRIYEPMPEAGAANPGALAPWHFLAAPVSFLLSLPFVPGLAQTVRKAARPWVTVILAAVGEGALIYGLGIWLGWTPAVMAMGFAGILAAHFLLGFLRWDKKTGDWKPVWFGSPRAPPLNSREFWDPYLKSAAVASTSLAVFLPALWPVVFGNVHPLLLAVGPHLALNLSAVLTAPRRVAGKVENLRETWLSLSQEDKTEALRDLVRIQARAFNIDWTSRLEQEWGMILDQETEVDVWVLRDQKGRIRGFLRSGPDGPNASGVLLQLMGSDVKGRGVGSLLLAVYIRTLKDRGVSRARWASRHGSMSSYHAVLSELGVDYETEGSQFRVYPATLGQLTPAQIEEQRAYAKRFAEREAYLRRHFQDPLQAGALAALLDNPGEPLVDAAGRLVWDGDIARKKGLYLQDKKRVAGEGPPESGPGAPFVEKLVPGTEAGGAGRRLTSLLIFGAGLFAVNILVALVYTLYSDRAVKEFPVFQLAAAFFYSFLSGALATIFQQAWIKMEPGLNSWKSVWKRLLIDGWKDYDWRVVGSRVLISTVMAPVGFFLFPTWIMPGLFGGYLHFPVWAQALFLQAVLMPVLHGPVMFMAGTKILKLLKIDSRSMNPTEMMTKLYGWSLLVWVPTQMAALSLVAHGSPGWAFFAISLGNFIWNAVMISKMQGINVPVPLWGRLKPWVWPAVSPAIRGLEALYAKPWFRRFVTGSSYLLYALIAGCVAYLSIAQFGLLPGSLITLAAVAPMILAMVMLTRVDGRPDLMRGHYGDTAAGYAAQWAHRIRPDVAEFRDRFLAMLPDQGWVLDAGTGPGRDAAWFKAQGRQAVGIDIDTEMLSQARLHHPETEFLQMNLTRLGFAGGTFSGIWDNAAFHFLTPSQAPQALEEYRRILASGGKLYMRVKEGEGEMTLTDPKSPAKTIYYNLYSQQRLRGLLESHGFRIIEMETKPEAAMPGLPARSVRWIQVLAERISESSSPNSPEGISKPMEPVIDAPDETVIRSALGFTQTHLTGLVTDDLRAGLLTVLGAPEHLELARYGQGSQSLVSSRRVDPVRRAALAAPLSAIMNDETINDAEKARRILGVFGMAALAANQPERVVNLSQNVDRAFELNQPTHLHFVVHAHTLNTALPEITRAARKLEALGAGGPQRSIVVTATDEATRLVIENALAADRTELARLNRPLVIRTAHEDGPVDFGDYVRTEQGPVLSLAAAFWNGAKNYVEPEDLPSARVVHFVADSTQVTAEAPDWLSRRIGTESLQALVAQILFILGQETVRIESHHLGEMTGDKLRTILTNA